MIFLHFACQLFFLGVRFTKMPFWFCKQLLKFEMETLGSGVGLPLCVPRICNTHRDIWCFFLWPQTPHSQSECGKIPHAWPITSMSRSLDSCRGLVLLSCYQCRIRLAILAQNPQKAEHMMMILTRFMEFPNI